MKSLTIWTIVLVILDQLSKLLASHFFPELIYKNYGSAFSMPINQNLVIALSFVVVVSACYFIYKHSFKHPTFIVLMLAGTLGNLIDRISYGYVIDFINFKVWPVFNFADVYLSLAICYLGYTYFHKEEFSNK